MKIVAAMLLALMLSACNPGLIDYPAGYFDLDASAGASAGVSDADAEVTARDAKSPSRQDVVEPGFIEMANDKQRGSTAVRGRHATRSSP